MFQFLLVYKDYRNAMPGVIIPRELLIVTVDKVL